jgi:glucose/arabinose dehydrogenase
MYVLNNPLRVTTVPSLSLIRRWPWISAAETVAVIVVTLISLCAKPVGAQGWPEISFSQPIGDFTYPTHLASARDGSGRLFVVEQPGRIRIIKNGTLLTTPFLDITARLETVVGSRGLFSVAFPPDFATKQHFYVNYVPPSGNVVVARYYVTSNPDIADANSEEIVLSEGPFPVHWGGELAFGPLDGYLYWGIGTGTPQAPNNQGHDLSVLRGKIMRIDVETGRYFPARAVTK